MNYLAHAYLSFQQPDILLGNLISDFVKGRKQYDYPLPVQRGIRLHRAIDTFTDRHEATQRIKAVFRPHYRLYAGAFGDVVYDHFLANDEQLFKTEADLKAFTQWCYATMQPREDLFPPVFDRMFPYMCSQDWLYHYRYREGIHKSFQGLVRRSRYLNSAEAANGLFNEHYAELEQCYRDFFPDIKTFAADQLQQLLNA